MVPLGPFEPAPHLAVAVSGGADSLALALLARDWAGAAGGMVTGLVVDHGLRPASADEARLTLRRLAGIGIAARLLVLEGLARGPGLAARARTARYAALEGACRQAGILHLLLGHHAADQAETVAMRLLARSGPAGLAGMAALAETEAVRLLRPLLTVPPARLRATLRAAGLDWVEDPSNADPAAARARLRLLRADRGGTGPATRALVAAARLRGAARAGAECTAAGELAARARLHPEGFAVLTPGPIGATALGALLRMLGGQAHAPSPRQLAVLAANPRPATLAGVYLLPAGRTGPPGALLLVREPAALAAPVAAQPGARWDGRFALAADATPPASAMLGALGRDAARFADRRHWPAAVLRALPALWANANLFAVPQIGYPDATTCRRVALAFRPAAPACGAPFAAAGQL
ncbi:MAG: tRNA lysidine(34) synthetase TilS [Rhodospirillales bacterium 70-18]|nr:tRNA lysidine(34) synthetase TilS [Rhodospirillales bacterium]OJY64798.1 MAG: tRNA lysidine(34) synthetase TilS [Rhodospirillales bacterium 70-18]